MLNCVFNHTETEQYRWKKKNPHSPLLRYTFFLVFIRTGSKLPVTKKVSFKDNSQRRFCDSSLSHVAI